jgi:mannose-6-phosphate isomerase
MTQNIPLYPLKFKPILQEKVWGGDKLSTYFNKKGNGSIGESWELSGVEGFVSIVDNGVLKGNDLNHLIDTFGARLMGEKVIESYGITFPLLFKFIDAREDLSVQLHPDDVLAKERHDSFGKTEMWYILDAKKDARLLLGFNMDMDEEKYLRYLSEKRIPEILHSEPVINGDSFFIAPGTVHAIGAGVMLAEIQQTSDITYRIYDWDRMGLDGKERELHTDLALKAINFKGAEARLNYDRIDNKPNLICRSPYFETNRLQLSEHYQRDLSEIDSFVVYMCVEGQASIQFGEDSVPVEKGETFLIPAVVDSLDINTHSATFLEVFIP